MSVKIYEAPNFIDSVTAWSRSMIRKDSLLKIKSEEFNIGIKTTTFKKILQDHPQANIDIELYNYSKHNVALELL